MPLDEKGTVNESHIPPHFLALGERTPKNKMISYFSVHQASRTLHQESDAFV